MILTNEGSYVFTGGEPVLYGGQVGQHGANQNALNLAPINSAKCRSEGAMTRPKHHLRIAQPPVLRYGLAVLSVSAALGGSLIIERYHLDNITLFLFAISVAAWYGGTAPAVLAFLLSCNSFAYFFVEPTQPVSTQELSTAYVQEIFKNVESGNGEGFFDHIADDVDWIVEGTHPLRTPQTDTRQPERELHLAGNSSTALLT